ncbi:hypothetical protein BES34_000050 [Leptospira inadai serovar Lyme]|uniref:Uncharacterized protein n=1 Tax=Leptospira inadai serovar Lyme TaxID=293084 RepID=A0ABX4YNE9_9LEPT|nr:hypothetical protein BES34_000050 [Leptospira inadai serovar Lyme]
MDSQNEQIPPGFSAESWNALTSEQKKQYLNAIAQSGGQGNNQAPAVPTQGQIYAEAGKQMLLGTIFSFFRSLLYRFLRF